MMGCPKSVELGDNLTFTVATHATTGAVTDADDAPTYRVYESETATPILTGTMAKLDDDNTTGLYAETIACTTANGFERNKTYTIYIEAEVNEIPGVETFGFTAKDSMADGLEALFGKPVIRTSQIAGIHTYDPVNAPDTIEDDAALLNAALASLEPSGVLFVDGIHAFLTDLIVPSGVAIESPDKVKRLHRFGDKKGGVNGHAIRNKNQQKGHPQPDEVTEYVDNVYPGFTSSLPLRLASGIDADDTACTLETNQGKLLEPAPGWITIGSEVCAYSDITGDVVTIARGDLAVAHNAATTVTQTIVDHDIKINVAIDCHADTFTYRYRFILTNPPSIYFNCGVSMIGVHNLDLSGLEVHNHPCWAVHVANYSGRVILSDIHVTTNNPNGAAGDDGIHINGPGGDLVIENVNLSTVDNTLAINFGEMVSQKVLSWQKCGGGNVGLITCRDSSIHGHGSYPPVSILGGPSCEMESLRMVDNYVDSSHEDNGCYGIHFQEIIGTTTVVNHLLVDGLVIGSKCPVMNPTYEWLESESWAFDLNNSQIGVLELKNITPNLIAENSNLVRIGSGDTITKLIRDNVHWEGQGDQIVSEGTITLDIEIPPLTYDAMTDGVDASTAATQVGTLATDYTTARAAKLDNLDTTISSRHASGAAVAKSPATLDWSADVSNPPTIGTSTITTDDIPTAEAVAAQVRTELTTELAAVNANLDAKVSNLGSPQQAGEVVTLPTEAPDGYGGGTLTVLPYAATATNSGRLNPIYLTAYQGCRFKATFGVYDANDSPVDLTGESLSLVAWPTDHPESEGFELVSDGDGAEITIGGADGNQIMIDASADRTVAVGQFDWRLYDSTQEVAHVDGVLRVVAGRLPDGGV